MLALLSNSTLELFCLCWVLFPHRILVSHNGGTVHERGRELRRVVQGFVGVGYGYGFVLQVLLLTLLLVGFVLPHGLVKCPGYYC